jgi:hypothetical protein
MGVFKEGPFKKRVPTTASHLTFEEREIIAHILLKEVPNRTSHRRAG